MRRYGRWGGKPEGVAEDKSRCVVAVYHNVTFAQCSRKRGHGPDGTLCRQHAEQLARGRRLHIPLDKNNT